MTRVTGRVVLLFSLGAILVACGGRQTPGYGGPPIANAVRAVVRPAPAHSGPLLFTGDGSNRPFVYTQVLVKNTSPYAVRIHGCIATALDGNGQELFHSSVVGPDTLLRPRHRMGGLRPGDYGGEVAPWGVTLDDVRAVARYAVSCEVFIWAGPFPTYEED